MLSATFSGRQHVYTVGMCWLNDNLAYLGFIAIISGCQRSGTKIGGQSNPLRSVRFTELQAQRKEKSCFSKSKSFSPAAMQPLAVTGNVTRSQAPVTQADWFSRTYLKAIKKRMSSPTEAANTRQARDAFFLSQLIWALNDFISNLIRF